MRGAGQLPVDVTDLLGAVPGAVAVQTGETFDFVSADLAALCGADADELVGADWRRLFTPREAARIEQEGIQAAREAGAWEGDARTGGRHVDERPVTVSLEATPDGAIVWVVAERDRDAADPFAASRQRYLRLIEAAPVPIWVQREETLVYVNPAAAEFFGADDPDEVVGRSDLEFVVPEERERSLRRNRRIIERDEVMSVMEGRKVGLDGETRYGLFAGAPIRFEGGEAILVIARDITERKERTRQLERQRDELATLDRINELLLETTRELVQTSSRAAVEQAVCEHLASSDLYRFAWVGERDPGGDGIVPRASAGDADGYLDAAREAESDETGGPADTAMRTGEVVAVNVDDPSFEPWAAVAAERGFESVAAVPLAHGETVYGVLSVYATREDAFSDREQAGFSVLGRTVGFVIYAARSRELLFSDAVVELSFRIADPSALLGGVAPSFGCDIHLDGYVTADEQWLMYLAVEDASVDAVSEALAEGQPAVRSRVLGDDRVELVVDRSPLLETATAAGATVTDATVTPDQASVTLEVPAGADVRDVVEAVESVYQGSTLQSRRERDREVTTVGRAGGPLDELTGRQRETLETAYRAGYFDWPRESTAEEVAAALNVSSPTLHNHLRRAESKILETLLEE